MDYELTDYEWRVIKPILPNKPRGTLNPAGGGGRAACGVRKPRSLNVQVSKLGSPEKDDPTRAQVTFVGNNETGTLGTATIGTSAARAASKATYPQAP